MLANQLAGLENVVQHLCLRLSCGSDSWMITGTLSLSYPAEGKSLIHRIVASMKA
jgi:hypothetical protein